MAQMEKVPTSSFFHSYAGEFDVSFFFSTLFILLYATATLSNSFCHFFFQRPIILF